jgi:hypothetical protein
MTQTEARKRKWWQSPFVHRELMPAAFFGWFVYGASGDWLWALIGFWAFGMVMRRFDELLDAINGD